MSNPLVRLQTAGATALKAASPNGATLRALSSHSECNYASVLISAERPDHYRL